eukprot:6172932-Pleurochrysis_carterae.AAC.1
MRPGGLEAEIQRRSGGERKTGRKVSIDWAENVASGFRTEERSRTEVVGLCGANATCTMRWGGPDGSRGGQELAKNEDDMISTLLHDTAQAKDLRAKLWTLAAPA